MSKQLKVKFTKTLMGAADQNCELLFINRQQHLEINVIKAEYPSLINKESILWHAELFSDQYDPSAVYRTEEFKSYLKDKIKKTEKMLDEMKFVSKAISRKNIIIKLESDSKY